MVHVRNGSILMMFLLCVLQGVTSGSDSERRAGEQGMREVETFTSAGVSGRLDGWTSMEDKFDDVYGIGMEGNNYFLKARAKDKSAIIAKECNYSLKEFPILTWKWRAYQLPQGGDERYKNSGDSVAGIYIIFPSPIAPGKLKNGFGIKIPIPDSLKPECLKYVWSSSLPKGTVIESPFSSKTRVIVVESGAASLKQWIPEEVNVFQDYLKAFGKEPDAVHAIGILTDADNTASEAIADYDDIFIKQDTTHSRSVSEDKRAQ